MQLTNDQQALLAEMLDSQAWQIALRIINDEIQHWRNQVANAARNGDVRVAYFQGRVDSLVSIIPKLEKEAGFAK